MKIVSILLLIASAFLSIKHGWDAFQPANAEQAKIMANLGISNTVMPYFGALSIIIGLILFFPQTFFLGNVLNAVMIVLIMALSLRAGDYKMALMEIPFLTLPLILIWLKYPFKF
ncbi:hypothetical protein [Flavobacterium sp. MDT1-60]|uniref:hypothetical protein n=1 Tax=Flavobacterium sp. MDT1-60 TaxID=1979344 RepID=UPI0017833D2A|nr:hypothetical protein [Flavobacterium sp. MDT1-60]QOG01570.1 hypothetical protein IHE43_17395 [Flavobacterium sp. MDT1-60]